jgi:AraC family transcriptional regulator, regulatory protein of adaptative response / methylated-DNA-[protein]-cysteine methyltransferase
MQSTGSLLDCSVNEPVFQSTMATAHLKQAHDLVEQDPRWIALISRKADSDGEFFYAVKTTGVYCRPSCPARLPRPEHVSFYTSCDEAEHAGFRPCKRCKPTQPSLAMRQSALMQSACRMIEASESVLTLSELAARLELSAYHFQRLFKRCIGVTPKAYAMAQREKRLRALLAQEGTVTEAIFNAGYQSSSRFYDHAARTVGMPPSAYRSGGSNMPIRFAVGECALGSILVAQSSQGLCAILLGDNPDELLQDLQARFPRAELIGADKEFEQLVAYVVGFVQAPGVNFDLPLDIRGTAFQQQVWNALRRIPPGQTLSYTELAKAIGMPRAVRAVAAACAANPLAVAIPCHRVVRSDGNLAGYRWKIERKRLLLETEAKAAAGKSALPEAEK